MTLRRSIRVLSCLCCLSGACAFGSASTYPITSPPVRAAENAPPVFVAELPGTTAAAADARAQAGCRNPMFDPRDGTRLSLVSSWRGEVGDYAAPAGRYGVRGHELLRLQCATGSPVGIVPRRSR